MAKHFVTIVAHAENLELRKDPGQIPYHVHKTFGWQSTLVTYFYSLEGGRKSGPLTPPKDDKTINKNYPYLKSEVAGLKMYFLNDAGRGKFYEKAIYNYLKNNAKNIAVLNLFHFNTENIFYSFLYKLINPKGKIYIKLDIDLNFYRSKTYFFNAKGPFIFIKKYLIQNIIYPAFFYITDVISAESESGFSYFKTRFKVPLKKMILLPNGVDLTKIEASNKIKPCSEKENIIITAGRIGTLQKNNQMLLDAINKLALKNWKIYFIGSIEPSFKIIIDAFYKQNPEYNHHVFFTGHINDPAVLYEYYAKAKVFCLTSLDEGFPIAACEAAFFGNYMVLTDAVHCFNELTNKGQFGVSIVKNDVASLANNLQYIIDNEELLKNKCEDLMVYSRKELSWQSLIPRLSNLFIE